MAQSTQVSAVLAYIDKVDKGNVDGAYEHVTEDFVYRVEPHSLASAAGHLSSDLNKDQYKAFHAQASDKYRGFETIIESVKETPGKVIVKAKTKFEQPGATVISHESPYTAEFELVGDKIRKANVVSHA